MVEEIIELSFKKPVKSDDSWKILRDAIEKHFNYRDIRCEGTRITNLLNK